MPWAEAGSSWRIALSPWSMNWSARGHSRARITRRGLPRPRVRSPIPCTSWSQGARQRGDAALPGPEWARSESRADADPNASSADTPTGIQSLLTDVSHFRCERAWSRAGDKLDVLALSGCALEVSL
jgi:hypothetical protein